MSEIADAVIRKAFFNDQLNDLELAIVKERVEIRDFSDGEPILTMQDASFPIVALVSGQVTVVSQFGEIINVINTGTLFGEIAFLDRQTRTADVVSKGDAQVVFLSEDLISHLEKDHPEMVSQLLLAIARGLCSKLRSAQRMMDASNFSFA